MSHDDHGHIQLEYQPSLPMSNGKVIIWLFLSTEIMFFAGLIGTYIVLRFGAPAWPSPHDVHVEEWVGAVNTFFLICSSVTVVLAMEFARKNQASLARICITATFVLGTIFLLLKGYEYNAKFSHGIYPMKPHSLIYEKADVHYAAAVRLKIIDKLAELGAAPPVDAGINETAEPSPDVEQAPAQALNEEQQQLRDDLVTLLTGFVGWASRFR